MRWRWRRGSGVLTVRREGDAWPGYAWRALNWRYNGVQVCGVELQAVVTASGSRGLLVVFAGRRTLVWIMRRGPWLWLYRRWSRGVMKVY